MILVDTSVWVDHLRVGTERLRSLLHHDEVICHPFVVGELACGNLRNRAEILRLLSALPMTQVAAHGGVLDLIESRRLYGRGIGWVDAHLLASAVTARVHIWTRDRRLRAIAAEMKLAASDA